MIARSVILIVAGAAVGCLSIDTRPSLTPTQVMHIAETKARASGFNPQNYGHTPATYDSALRLWWIRYCDRATQEPMFAVDVEDKTGKATFKNRETFVKFVH